MLPAGSILLYIRLSSLSIITTILLLICYFCRALLSPRSRIALLIRPLFLLLRDHYRKAHKRRRALSTQCIITVAFFRVVLLLSVIIIVILTTLRQTLLKSGTIFLLLIYLLGRTLLPLRYILWENLLMITSFDVTAYKIIEDPLMKQLTDNEKRII